MSGGLVRMLSSPSRLGADAFLLPAIAFTVVTTVTLGAVSVAVRLWSAPDNEFSAYKLLTIALLTLLLIPLVGLAGAAARLSAQRRDDRLAALRLVGARTRTIRTVALGEAMLPAAIGIACGSILWLLVAPLSTRIPVQERTIPFDAGWLPWWAVAAVALAIAGVVVVAVLVGLRRVVVTPLGVHTRSEPRGARLTGMLVGVGVIVAALLLMQSAAQNWGVTGIAAAYIAGLGAIMAAIGLIGPVVTKWVATIRVWTARSPAGLIAARTVLDDPKAAWRQVSGVAVACFLVIPAGSILGYLNTISTNSDAIGETERLLFGDFRTVAALIVGASFLIVACSVGVTQAAAILERRRVYVALDRLGMPRKTMHQLRRNAVQLPLGVAVIGSAVLSTALVFMVVILALVSSPLFIVGVVLLLTAGILLVLLAITATTPVLATVLSHPERSL